MLSTHPMRAVEIARQAAEASQVAEVFRLTEIPAPAPGPEEVRVRVHAAALNRADLLQARGRYPPPPGIPEHLPGLEYAGEIAALGARARGWRVGDRVMGLLGGAALAEEIVADARTLLAVPEGLGLEEAAAFPEAFLTAHDALVVQATLSAGEHVLVHAAASGVGTAASQLCTALGANVIGTVRSASKVETIRTLGVRTALVCEGEPPRFADAVRAATGGSGADVALDLVGGSYFPETIDAMAPRGRVMAVGLLGGGASSLDLLTVLRKRLVLRGTVMRARGLDERIADAAAARATLLPLLAAGRVKPVVHAVLSFARVQEGVAALANDETIGKVVLSWART